VAAPDCGAGSVGAGAAPPDGGSDACIGGGGAEAGAAGAAPAGCGGGAAVAGAGTWVGFEGADTLTTGAPAGTAARLLDSEVKAKMTAARATITTATTIQIQNVGRAYIETSDNPYRIDLSIPIVPEAAAVRRPPNGVGAARRR
jgi:hypothetical protein